MKLITQINYNNLKKDKEVIDRLFNENIEWKMDRYLLPFDKNWIEPFIKINLKKIKSKFSWSLNFIGKSTNVIIKRTYFEKLDDLVNHLFKHLKEKIRKEKNKAH